MIWANFKEIGKKMVVRQRKAKQKKKKKRFESLLYIIRERINGVQLNGRRDNVRSSLTVPGGPLRGQRYFVWRTCWPRYERAGKKSRRILTRTLACTAARRRC